MKKIKLEEFELFERLNRQAKYNVPALTITNNGVYLNRKATELLGLTSDTRMILAKRGECTYIAVVPITSNIKGYSVQILEHNCAHICMYKPEKRGLELGEYFILDPIFSGNIDWFELELIK